MCLTQARFNGARSFLRDPDAPIQTMPLRVARFAINSDKTHQGCRHLVRITHENGRVVTDVSADQIVDGVFDSYGTCRDARRIRFGSARRLG